MKRKTTYFGERELGNIARGDTVIFSLIHVTYDIEDGTIIDFHILESYPTCREAQTAREMWEIDNPVDYGDEHGLMTSEEIIISVAYVCVDG